MSESFNRRGVMAGLAGSVIGVCALSSARAQVNPGPPYAPGRSPYWYPGPNKALKKDLRTGSTSVRLGGALTVAAAEAAEAALSHPPPEPQLVPVGTAGFGWAPPPAPGQPAPPPAPSPPIPSLSESVDLMRRLRKAGVSAARVMPRSWMSLSDSDLAQFKAVMKELDFDFVEVGTYRNPLHPDPVIRAGYIKECIQNMEACERVGCRSIGVTAGSRYMPNMAAANNFAPDPENWSLESWRMTVDYFKQVLNATKGSKTGLGIEAIATTMLDTPISHTRMMEDLADDRVCVVFDPTNSIHLMNYWHTTEMLTECFDMWGERIVNLHGKDCYLEPRMQSAVVREVTPGLGTMDYETILRRLSRLKWPRSITPEIGNSEWPATYAHIRKVAARVGVKIHGDTA
jgi:sugar phosphate isomerase/epimerase